MSAEAEPIVGLGAILGGGPAGDVWGRACGALHTEIEAMAQGWETPFRLEVHFHVSGTIRANEFEGVRTATLSRKQRRLWMQVAMSDDPADDPRAVLIDLLSTAVDEAERYLIAKKLVEGLPEIQRLMRELKGS